MWSVHRQHSMYEVDMCKDCLVWWYNCCADMSGKVEVMQSNYNVVFPRNWDAAIRLSSPQCLPGTHVFEP